MTQRLIQASFAALLLAGAPFGASAQTPETAPLEKASLYIGWRAEAEFGGFFQAVAKGIYRKHGLQVDIQLGNPQSNPAPLLISGKVTFSIGSSGSALNAAREGAPITAIAAIFQKDPRVLLGHPGQGYAKLEDMVDRTAYIGALGMATFWPFLRQRFGFKDRNVKPYTFSIAPFLADKASIQQGLATTEPYALQKAGMEKPVMFLLDDYGYRPYAVTIAATHKTIASRPDFVQKFVDASIEGWADYLNGDAKPGNDLIKQNNPDMSDDHIRFAMDVMRRDGFVEAGDARQLGIGAMTDERWKDYYKALVDSGVLPGNVDVSKAYTLQFVNKRVGLK